MQTGTQIYAPEGFDSLAKGKIYHLLRNDGARQRVLLVSFQPKNIAGTDVPGRELNDKGKRNIAVAGTALRDHTTQLSYVARHRFEIAIESGEILILNEAEELPPWFSGLSIDDLRSHRSDRYKIKVSHEERIARTLQHLQPLVQNLDEILSAENPDLLINAHARSCSPPQNEKRFRIAFYSYICFGFTPWSLHYGVHRIGHWDRFSKQTKLGRPSRLLGANHGYGTNDTEVLAKIEEGYRRFAGHGQHLSKIYRKTMTKIFCCVMQTEPSGRKRYVHPSGLPFPSFGQFCYRIGQIFSLESRQLHKYGHSHVRTKLKHSQGRYSESVGNVMERTEQDAYCSTQVSVGYLPGVHLPPLWVVRIRCLASGMIVGVGFSVGAELASGYRMALFCAAIDKVKFCSLFGQDIVAADWPSIGLSPHMINDRGPGSTSKADGENRNFNPIIKEAAPSYSGQSKASIETTHPKTTKGDGKPQFRETRLSIPQLAAQEVLRVIADNNSFSVIDRLNNSALIDEILPVPTAIWNYLNKKGRNQGITPVFNEAVRSYLTPIELIVRDDAVYFKDARYDSASLRESGILQKAHDLGRYSVKGYMLDACVRHLWVDIDSELIEVDAMLNIRDSSGQLYISVLEIEQIQELRRRARLELSTHQLAARSEYEQKFEDHTGIPFDQSTIKYGRSSRGKKNSLLEQKEIIDYVRSPRKIR